MKKRLRCGFRAVSSVWSLDCTVKAYMDPKAALGLDKDYSFPDEPAGNSGCVVWTPGGEGGQRTLRGGRISPCFSGICSAGDN
jgi:hypothetical protein